MDPSLEEHLAEYLDRELKTNVTRDSLLEAFNKVSQGLQQQSIDNAKRWEENTKRWNEHIALHDNLDKRIKALEVDRERLVEERLRSLERARKSVSSTISAISSSSTSIPPMRAESPSYHDAIEQATREAKNQVKDAARKTPGPPTLIDADEAVRIAGDVFTKMAAEREESVKEKAEQDRLIALDLADQKAKSEAKAQEDLVKEEARKTSAMWKRLFRYGIPAAFLVSAATAAGGIAVGMMRGHSQGRAEVIGEVQEIAKEQAKLQIMEALSTKNPNQINQPSLFNTNQPSLFNANQQMVPASKAAAVAAPPK
jgi:hypothetical protein